MSVRNASLSSLGLSADVKRISIKSGHTCDPQILQQAQFVTDILGKLRQELIYWLTYMVNSTAVASLCFLSYTRKPASIGSCRRRRGFWRRWCHRRRLWWTYRLWWMDMVDMEGTLATLATSTTFTAAMDTTTAAVTIATVTATITVATEHQGNPFLFLLKIMCSVK
jgi:hypothetical protein